MDFSFAGYGGGGKAIPTVKVSTSISPSGGDDSQSIQAAIDDLSKANSVDEFRGAILLQPGTFECSRPITIKTSGIVLRGSGSGPGGTVLKMTGEPHICITITGSDTWKEAGISTTTAADYVPAGTSMLLVANTAGFEVGNTVRIVHPVTSAWVQFMGMDKMVRNGKAERWVSGDITTERTITNISAQSLSLDIPLSDALDPQYLKPSAVTVKKGVAEGYISQIGVENLRIVSPPQPVAITDPHHSGIHLNGVTDAWVRDVGIENAVGSIQVGSAAKRVTIEAVRMAHTEPTQGAAKPADLAADGSQILFDRCTGSGNDIFYFVTGGRVTGPNVLLHCTFHGNGHIQPHMRWATGLLVDSCEVSESGIDFMNRGEMGSGHGWTLGWGVAWNCVAKSFVIQQPPGAMNWAIGCIGTPQKAAMPFGKEPLLPEGTYDSPGAPVAPSSLYLGQLQERLGPQALKNIGY